MLPNRKRNIPLYKLCASQIWWLSELALLEFTFHYQTRRSNKAADALSRHPHTEEETKIKRDSDCNEGEVISYSSTCEVVEEYLNTDKIPDGLKKEAFSVSCVGQSIVRKRMQKK